MENTSKVTAKDFFIWAGAMVGLYWSIIAFLVLLFEYIDRAFPDIVTNPYIDPYGGSIRFSMASLIVLGPLTVVLLRIIRRGIEADASKAEIWVRRWALVLTIFVAGLSIAIDLITLVNTFLGGELTTRFILKVASVLLVASAAFMHFYADLKGFWRTYPERARLVGYAFALLTILTVVAGFLIIGSPTSIRLMRLDDQKVGDLQNVQWQVVNYWQQKQTLPKTLNDLSDAIAGTIVPTDPQSGASYEYKVTGSMTFTLCATFNKAGGSNTGRVIAEPVATTDAVGSANDNWQHGEGVVCFTRTIDPERYPPFPKTIR